MSKSGTFEHDQLLDKLVTLIPVQVCFPDHQFYFGKYSSHFKRSKVQKERLESLVYIQLWIALCFDFDSSCLPEEKEH